MGALDADMKRVIAEQSLGFIATVGTDGSPNLSPRGTVAVWDDDHLVVADIRSPNTTRNLRANPSVEINVIDPILRKGYRFKGTATIEAPTDESIRFYDEWGLEDARERIRAVIRVRVEKAVAVTSPAYDRGATEAELKKRYLGRLNDRFRGSSP